VAPTGEQGKSGLVVAGGGYVEEELHPHLSGRRALETWRTMKDNEAVVGAIMFAIDMLVRQVEWSVDQKDAKEEDAQFLEEAMDDMSMSWGDFLSEALSMVPFGFSFHEIVYKRRNGPQRPGSKTPSSRFSDGKVGWRKMPLRAQETLDHWQFDEEGGIEAFVQRAAPDYTEIVIPMEKGLLFRTTVYKNNPEGRSVLRSAYVSWYYKKRIQQIEGTGIERDLAGFPVIWMPAEFLMPDATPDQVKVRQAFEQIGQNIRRDKQEYLLMPLAYNEAGNKAYDIELLSASGSRQFDTSAVIQRYNQEIAMSVLADFILLGHEKVGSFALSSDKTDLFAVALGTFLDSIQDVMNRYAVPRLFALNGLDTENLPEITHGDIEKPDLTALGTFLGSLVGAGMPLFPDEDLENFLRRAGGMPEKSDEAKQAQEAAAETSEEPSDAEGADGGGPAGGPGSGTNTGTAADGSGSARPRGEGAAGSSGSQRGGGATRTAAGG
jgi:hypothetical protein